MQVPAASGSVPADRAEPAPVASASCRAERPAPRRPPAGSAPLAASASPGLPDAPGPLPTGSDYAPPARPARAWITPTRTGGQSRRPGLDRIGDLMGTAPPPKRPPPCSRVAATIPSATVVPHAIDAAGGAGIAVASSSKAPPGQARVNPAPTACSAAPPSPPASGGWAGRQSSAAGHC
jgi:hypothetical protein